MSNSAGRRIIQKSGLWALLMAMVFAISGCTRTFQGAPTVVTYHVDKAGNDNNPGSKGSPFLTINKAAQVARPGDTVIVHAGTYREWVQPLRGGVSDELRITYRAATGEKVVIKGSERVNTWKSQGNGMWKVELDDSFFAPSNWYPFRDTVLGEHQIGKDWLGVGRWCHKGEVFLNEDRYIEKNALDECRKTPGSWFTSRQGTTQSIYANFGDHDPNRELAEITVRHAVFGKDVQDGIDFITVDGLTLMQSSEEWLPTYAGPNSRGVIFTSGTGWVIQNCTVLFAKMRGIVTDHGSHHVVRNNTIGKCGSAGIGGADTEGVVISGNWIYDIHGDQPYTGAEHGGIKYHTSRNLIISGNIISGVHALEDMGDKGMGIWMDWPKGNNRITGNVVVNCTGRGLMIENPFGPHLIDNNVLINNQWPSHFESANILVNNLFHSTTLWFRSGWWGRARNESNKVFNNMFFASATNLVANAGNEVDYNSYHGGARKPGFGDLHSVVDATEPRFSCVIDNQDHSVTLTFSLGKDASGLSCPIVTTESIGTLNCGRKDMEKTTKEMLVATMTRPDGKPVAVDKDFFQHARGAAAKVGPFQGVTNGLNTFVLCPNSDFDYQAAGRALIDKVRQKAR